MNLIPGKDARCALLTGGTCCPLVPATLVVPAVQWCPVGMSGAHCRLVVPGTRWYAGTWRVAACCPVVSGIVDLPGGACTPLCSGAQ